MGFCNDNHRLRLSGSRLRKRKNCLCWNLNVNRNVCIFQQSSNLQLKWLLSLEAAVALFLEGRRKRSHNYKRFRARWRVSKLHDMDTGRSLRYSLRVWPISLAYSFCGGQDGMNSSPNCACLGTWLKIFNIVLFPTLKISPKVWETTTFVMQNDNVLAVRSAATTDTDVDAEAVAPGKFIPASRILLPEGPWQRVWFSLMLALAFGVLFLWE